jgi:predicted AlkP superfamily phosphohydrolase/phosphomutase
MLSSDEVSSRRKVLVIGLDGGSWNLLHSMVRLGLVPHLEALLNSGTSGVLLSVDPPMSPSAWASFITGQNPGKHGVFDFAVPVQEGYHLKLVNANMIAPDSLWSVLGQNGRRIGVINVPLTFPPQEVNGFIVSGMMTPSSDSSFTFPRELKYELIEQLGTYQIELDSVRAGRHIDEGFLSKHFSDHFDRFLSSLNEMTDIRQRAIEYLMTTRSWDFFMAVIVGTDRIQHYLWDYLVNDFADSDPRAEVRDRVLDYYRKVDAIVGDLVDRVDDDTIVIVVSDHGFGPSTFEVHLNRWLVDIGMLVPKGGVSGKLVSRLGYLLKSKGISRQKLAKILRLKRIEKVSTFAAAIDWSKTRAGQRLPNSIHLNVRGRDPEGIVQPGDEYESLRDLLIEQLMKLTDPTTGHKVVTEALKKEVIYHGPYLQNAPDIVIRFAEGYSAYRRSLDVTSWLKRPIVRTGEHRREGIVILKGRGVREKFQFPGPVSIMDIFPTVLYLLDCSIPAKTDGRVLSEAFTPAFLRGHPIEHSKESDDSRNRTMPSDFTEEEAQAVMSRLKGLGYLG